MGKCADYLLKIRIYYSPGGTGSAEYLVGRHIQNQLEYSRGPQDNIIDRCGLPGKLKCWVLTDLFTSWSDVATY